MQTLPPLLTAAVGNMRRIMSYDPRSVTERMAQTTYIHDVVVRQKYKYMASHAIHIQTPRKKET